MRTFSIADICCRVVLAALLVPISVAAQNAPLPKAAHCSVTVGGAAFPEALRGSGIQGSVRLRPVVDANGCAHDVRVVKKVHPQLDEVAKQTVKTWKFEPALKDGRPVKVQIELEVPFKDPGHRLSGH